MEIQSSGKWFLGESLNYVQEKDLEDEEKNLPENPEVDSLDDVDAVDDVDTAEDAPKEAEDDEVDEEKDEIEPTETQVADRIKDKNVERAKPLQMIRVQLLKDAEETSTSSRKSRRRASRGSVEDDTDEDWLPEDVQEAFKVMRERKIFDVSDMYTIAAAWGWTWERDLKARTPLKRSQEWEIELAIKIMQKVIEPGGTPTIGDCTMILRATIRSPLPSAFLTILQTVHSLGYIFGRVALQGILTEKIKLM